MRSREMMHCSGKIIEGLLLTVLLTSISFAIPRPLPQADSSLGKLKSMAEAQHEIVLLLIKKQEYEKAAAEANKIFDMKWPDDQESILLKALLTFSGQFLSNGQASLGLKLIERNSKFFKRASSQAEILKEMGYIYKSLNQIDKSIDYFKKARDLEGGK